MQDRVAIQTLWSSFLNRPERPQYTMNFSQLDGYLRALACTPGTINLNERILLVFADEDPVFKDEEERGAITNAFVSLYNFHAMEVANNLCTFPCSWDYIEEREARIDIEQWTRGFLQGYIVSQAQWTAVFNENQTSANLPDILLETIYDEIDAILTTVSTVADAEYALQNGKNIHELKVLFGHLPQHIIDYGKIGQRFRTSLLN